MGDKRIPRDRGSALRRLALFLSFLISGGLLLFPRLPVLLMLILLCVTVTGLRLPPGRRLWPLYALLGAVLLISLARTGPVHVESLAISFANFMGALALLNVYLQASPGALARDLYAILRWMAIQAVATVVLAHAVGFLFVPVSFADNTFQSLLLVFNYHVMIEDAGGLIRPDGFFFEPGVFQFYLNLYLYLALFVFRDPRHVALAVMAVLSTQSTTGILICMLLLGTALLQRLGAGGLRRKVATALVALVVAPPVVYLGYGNVSDKLFGETQGSSWAREYDLFTGLNVIAENPLLGIGFDHDRYLSASGRLGYADTLLKDESVEDRPTSNGLVYLTYSLGIPMAMLLFLCMFRQTLFHHRVLIGLWLSLSMFGEAIVFTPFVMMVIFSAFLARRPSVVAARVRSARVPTT